MFSVATPTRGLKGTLVFVRVCRVAMATWEVVSGVRDVSVDKRAGN